MWQTKKAECGGISLKEFSPELATADSDEYKVYKVVGHALRCIAVGLYDLQYLVGEFVTAPEGTKIFVFESLMCVAECKQRGHCFRIWRATAIGLYLPAGRITDSQYSVDIQDFWQVHNSGPSYGFLSGRRTPSGTLWADAIKLDAYVG
jgi:hypothetical protein